SREDERREQGDQHQRTRGATSLRAAAGTEQRLRADESAHSACSMGGSTGPSSAASISGPSIVTSPAPTVRTRSPARAQAATIAGTADQDGSNATRSAGSPIASATSAP